MNGAANGKFSLFFYLKKTAKFYLWLIFLLVIFGLGVFWGVKKAQVKVISLPPSEDYGVLVGKETAVPEYLSRDVNFKIFWDVWNIIQNQYVERPVGETKLFYGALGGLVSGLGDPFSSFLEPKETVELTESLSGKFEGIGAEIGMRNEVVTVISPLPESPAEKAGLRSADVITEIDAVSTLGMDLSEAVSRIRGDKGTSVNLKIFRPKSGKLIDIPVVRDTIKIISVSYQLLGGDDYQALGVKRIALVKVTNFNSDTSERFAEAVNKILLDNPSGLIIDLRSNPGGYLESAVALADYWLDKGVNVVSEKLSGGGMREHPVKNPAVLDKFRTVVLINGGSASGSEILAGALQDYDLARLIGEKTFGKGSVQQLFDLEDGSSVKLTIAKWLTPHGRQIDGAGIEPDLKVEMTEDDYNNDRDPQLEKAVQFFVDDPQ